MVQSLGIKRILRAVGRRIKPMQIRNKATVVEQTDFDPETLPWLDRPEPPISSYVNSLSLNPEEKKNLKEQLEFFKENGYLVMKGAINPEAIDAYLNDIDRLFVEGKSLHTMITDNRLGNFALKQHDPSQLDLATIRVCDFHNNSERGKKLVLAEPVMNFLKHVFRLPVVGMQTLTFIKGSQQDWHQDFPYVVSQIPSHLAAAWVALEDVHPDAGPLGYFPKSHHIRKFNFGNGLFMTSDSPLREDKFARYLEEECTRQGLKPESFTPKKGDVFIWHASLVHRGMPVNNPALTRKSLVSHYSSSQGYTFDRRNPDIKPTRYEMNGGYVFGHPNYPSEENFFADN